MVMQAFNSSRFVLTKKSGAWRFDSACATESGLVTINGVLPFTHLFTAALYFS
jgi:hypothetical protein